MCGLVMAVVMLWHTPASAQAFRCNPNGTQPELNACAHQRYQAADRELNRVYRQVLKKMKKNAPFVKNFRAAQRAWIRLRDADLKALYTCPTSDMRRCWGSMYNLLHNSDLEAMTKARVRFLKGYLTEQRMESLEDPSLHQ